MANTVDTIIIGAGHNGLVAAAYLARAGRKVLVLERREVIGGGAVTEEVFRGFKFDTAAHDAYLRPDIVRDLDLARHGLQMVVGEATLYAPQAAGRGLLLSSNPAQAAEAIEHFSKSDAHQWPEFTRLLGKAARFLARVQSVPIPSITTNKIGELFTLARVGLGLRGLGRDDMMEAIRLLPISVHELLNDWFESDALKGAVGAGGISGLNQGPRAAGTTLMLLHHMACAAGALIARGQVRGGMGALTSALAAAARERGVEIRTGAEVTQIVIKDGRATGVALKSGEEFSARQVVSNADPRRTMALAEAGWFDPEFLWQVNNIRMRGATAKINLALAELPRFKNAPDGDGHLRGRIVIAPNLEYLERASDAAKYGEISEHPYLEAVIPTLADPSLAPEGRHVMSLHAQYAPYKLNGGWNDKRRRELADRVINTLAEYAPNIKQAILHQQVLSPADLEATFNLTEGNLHHGEMMLDQAFFMRPVGGAAQYRMPLEGLYLCGAGAHPGGGVTGAPGRLAARAVLRG